MSEGDFRCPGQNTMFWKPDDIYDVLCPSCGAPVEFWKDDAKRVCKCGHRFLNPKRDLGCLEYCKYAESCMPEMFQGEDLKALYRDRLLAAVRRMIKPDESNLQKTWEVSELVTEILTKEGGEPKVVVAATILKDLLNSARAQGAGEVQTDSDIAIGKRLLAEVGTEREVVDKVCAIIEHKTDKDDSGDINLQIVMDALNLTGLLEKRALLEKPALERLVERKLQTKTAKSVAKERLL